jgi:hypothetical protein
MMKALAALLAIPFGAAIGVAVGFTLDERDELHAENARLREERGWLTAQLRAAHCEVHTLTTAMQPIADLLRPLPDDDDHDDVDRNADGSPFYDPRSTTRAE